MEYVERQHCFAGPREPGPRCVEIPGTQAENESDHTETAEAYHNAEQEIRCRKGLRPRMVDAHVVVVQLKDKKLVKKSGRGLIGEFDGE